MTTSDKHNPPTASTQNSPADVPATENMPALKPAPAKKNSVKKASASTSKTTEKTAKVVDNGDKVPSKSTKSTAKPTAKIATTKPTTAKPKAPIKTPAGEKKTSVKTASASKVKIAGATPTAKPATTQTLQPAAQLSTTSLTSSVTKASAIPLATDAPNCATSDKTTAKDIPNDATDVAKKSKTAQLLGKQAAKNQKQADWVAIIQRKCVVYSQLMRLHRPIGILLLLWPTLWSLWLAAKGMPSLKNLLIFSLGVVIMRSAGCVINDFADRKIDSKVQRTQDRPLATGAASNREAITLFVVLCATAFGLVLLTDPLTIKLSVGGLLLAFCYPFMKRHTHLPQIVLGAAFAWSIPMAFAAEAGELTQELWLIYLAVVLWTVVYDTFYAMVDRDDDIKIGVKSTAILFGEQDRFITGLLQVMTLYTLFIIGDRFELGGYYYTSVAVAGGLFAYQQWLIRFRARAACFNAFLNNNWVGLAIFVGIAADFALR